ncbi:DUF502 domain-containing protein [bacterium]|nr:DUF502 domain-containing protein [bacterium]
MKGILKKVTTWFISGLITILPLALTIGLLGWIYTKIVSLFGKDSAIGRILVRTAETHNLPSSLTIICVYLAIIVLIILIGAFVHIRARNRVSEWIKGLVNRFPVINSIYNSAEQVVGIFGKTPGAEGQGDDPAHGSNIVLVRFANTLILGMLPSQDAVDIGGVPHYMVYFPSTPVPMSGFNYLVPADSVFMTELKFDDLTKVLVSLGALAPQTLGGAIELKPAFSPGNASADPAAIEPDGEQP